MSEIRVGPSHDPGCSYMLGCDGYGDHGESCPNNPKNRPPAAVPVAAVETRPLSTEELEQLDNWALVNPHIARFVSAYRTVAAAPRPSLTKLVAEVAALRAERDALLAQLTPSEMLCPHCGAKLFPMDRGQCPVCQKSSAALAAASPATE